MITMLLIWRLSQSVFIISSIIDNFLNHDLREPMASYTIIILFQRITYWIFENMSHFSKWTDFKSVCRNNNITPGLVSKQVMVQHIGLLIFGMIGPILKSQTLRYQNNLWI